jgi:pyruvate/2-oxoglutarate dehydrogenase complex dihydrolipoamide acyltransferase (E2) component
VSQADTIVRMPKLADTLVEGTLGQWLKQVGETVSRGEPLASIETDKVTTELTSPADGTVLEVLIEAGRTVPVETPIARIGFAATASGPKATPPEPIASRPEASPSAVTVSRRKPTPLAARLLTDNGLTPEQIPTQSLRLKRDDVLAFIKAKPSVEPEAKPLTSMRRAIAEHMTRAYETIPHGQTVISGDLTEVVRWREARKQGSPNLTFTALFVYALSRAMQPPAHVGVAVALQSGLIVPVLKDAHALSLAEVATGIADLAKRARANQLRPEDVQGASMSVTNVGSFGNIVASPIVPLGQVAILAPGLVERRPMPTPEGGTRPGWRCLVSLVFDRRAFDDLAADRFLRAVADQLTALPHSA